MTRWFKHVDCPKAERSISKTGYWNGRARCPYCGSEDVTEISSSGKTLYEDVTYDPSDGSAKGVRG